MAIAADVATDRTRRIAGIHVQRPCRPEERLILPNFNAAQTATRI